MTRRYYIYFQGLVGLVACIGGTHTRSITVQWPQCPHMPRPLRRLFRHAEHFLGNAETCRALHYAHTMHGPALPGSADHGTATHGGRAAAGRQTPVSTSCLVTCPKPAWYPTRKRSDSTRNGRAEHRQLSHWSRHHLWWSTRNSW